MTKSAGIAIYLFLATTIGLAQPLDYEGFFKRTSGWTGADGTYSFPLGEEGVVWGFSDTFFGEVVDNTRVAPFRFVNNSFVLQKEAELTFLKAPVFQPPDDVGWFWLFDGLRLEHPSSNQILLGQFRTNGLAGAFAFEQCGLWWAEYAIDKEQQRVRVLRYRKLPYFVQNEKALVTFGSAITQVGPWAYIYGILQQGLERKSVVARAPKASLGEAGTWRFFDGESWQRDIWRAAPLFQGASVEYSVHQSQSGQFVYIGNAEGGMHADIVARRAPSPTGPWSEPIRVGQAPEHKDTVFVYNAKAHPELSQNGKILISYNVNTSDLDQVVNDADIYRPRFLWWTPPSSEWLP